MTRQCVSIVVAALVLAAGCGDGSGGVRRLSIATGGTGGVYYPYGGGIAQLLTSHLSGVEATAEVTAASVDNLKFLHQGTSDLAFTMADIAQDALAGRDVFESFGPVQVRALAVLYYNYMHLVTRTGSGIERLDDLPGRIVSLGTPGGGGTVLAERILAAAGIDQGALRVRNLGVAQAADALKDGKIDAFFWSGGVPTSSVLDLVHTPGISIRLLPLDHVLEAMQQRHDGSLYARTVIPADVYGLPADVPVIGVDNMLVATDRLPDDLAYDITRVLFEERDALVRIHPQARELALETAVAGSTIPFHPGAIRYFREQGVWTE
jgi:TRAP transporter TAXI family solute receptor